MFSGVCLRVYVGTLGTDRQKVMSDTSNAHYCVCVCGNSRFVYVSICLSYLYLWCGGEVLCVLCRTRVCLLPGSVELICVYYPSCVTDMTCELICLRTD